MFCNNIRVAIRNLFKNKLITIINILGISASIMLAIHLTSFAINEFSFDRFNNNVSNIFRILSKFERSGENANLFAICQGQFPLYASTTIPEVKAYVRIKGPKQINFDFNNKRYIKHSLIYVDSTFFDVFSIKLLYGEPHIDLSIKGNIYICESIANKVFGSINCKGEIVIINNKKYTISGVFQDVPNNSHLQFELLSGTCEVEKYVKNSGLEFLIYVELRDNVDKRKAIKKVCEKYDTFSESFWKNSEYKCKGQAQFMKDIWLHSSEIVGDVPHGNINNIFIAIILIVFISLISISNFISLAIIQADGRSKEIGLRKMAGATSRNIEVLFMVEAFLIIIISILIAIIFTGLTKSLFYSLIGKQILLTPSNSIKLALIIVGICLFMGIIAGAYPSIYLSKFPVIRILKEVTPFGKRNNNLNRFLVFLQFSIVIFLLSDLVVFYKQMNFIRNKDFGFHMEHVVGISDQTGGIYKSYKSIKQILLQNPAILNVSLAQGISIDEMSGQLAHQLGETKEIMVNQNRTTLDFITTFGIKIIEGRDFSPDLPTDNHAYIINETAKTQLNLPKNAIGQRLILNKDTGDLIGVVKDYHFASLHDKVEPLFITLDNQIYGTIFVKIKSGEIRQSLDFITTTLQKFDPRYILEYEFVDDKFNHQYISDQKINMMTLYAAMFSILISLMGLVALTNLTITTRTKEVGIRKVFGDSVCGVTNIILFDIIRWVMLGNFLALPIAYIIMRKWLISFAYRIDFPYILMISAGIIAIAIATLVILRQVIKIAIHNPVDALRYE